MLPVGAAVPEIVVCAADHRPDSSARRPAGTTTVDGPLSARSPQRASGCRCPNGLRWAPRFTAQTSPVRTALTSWRGCTRWARGLMEHPAHPGLVSAVRSGDVIIAASPKSASREK